MSLEQQQLRAGIRALEAQRALLGDAVVDASLAGLHAKLAALAWRPPASAGPTQALRQVSILFLDVVGSTTLAQRLDPEAISAVLDDALNRGTVIVEHHQGRVLQYAGDNILAAFGADGAREDDAERAVRCGLALLTLGRTLAAEVLSTHDHAGFNVRVGVHTGGVLLGGGVDAEGSIRGQAVNVAARMEQTAGAGALRISHATYAQVRGMFDVELQELLVVKGIDEPVQSYLVTRAKPRSFRIGTRGIEGIATRMIGRDAELEALQDAFLRLFAERTLAVVTVVAEAGVGKSRLLYEFESWAETRPEAFYVFRGRATPQTQGQPFGLLRDILAWRFQITDDDTIEAARAKLEAGIIPLFMHDDGADLAEGHAHVLGHLIGIEYRDSRHVKGILDDPRQIHNRALHVAAQLLRRVSAVDGSPVVLQLEDLHWADNESLDFLNYLAEVDRDVAMLILSFSRPTLFERRADWKKSNEGVHRRIDLSSLDKNMSHFLVEELLKKLRPVPVILTDLIIGRAEGNPFYMEELVKMLIDEGAIQTGLHGEEDWMLNPDKLQAAHVPATLTGVLQARLDGLPEAERQTLQEASVIGQVFWDQALIALNKQTKQTLPALVRRELTLPRGDASQDGMREYAFRHQILHQVTYGTVLKRTRRELHGKLADWLSKLSGLRANDFLRATAEHYEQAGDELNAAEYHTRAAEHAGKRLAHDTVLSHVQRALLLLETHSADTPDSVARTLRWRLLWVRERALEFQGRRAEQAADIEALEQLADVLGDEGRQANAAWRRSFMALRTADWLLQETAARRGATLAEHVGDDELRLRCLRMLAGALVYQGEWRVGKSLAQDALAQARELGLRKVESGCLNVLVLVAAQFEGDSVAALELSGQCLMIDREIGDRRAEAIALGNIGASWLELGALPQARRDLEDALRMMRANGDRQPECNALIQLSLLARWRSDHAEALSLARLAWDLAVSVRARNFEALALVSLGHAELAAGRHGEAMQAFEQGRELAVYIENSYQHDATVGLARVALAQTDLSAALQQVQRLLAHVDGGGTFDGVEQPALLELTCYEVLSGTGDGRALEWLARARTRLQATAEGISDSALRRGFLYNIPHHRDIVAACAASLSEHRDIVEL